jgi:hypothetical protein
MIPIVESAALFAPVATGLAWLGGVATAGMLAVVLLVARAGRRGTRPRALVLPMPRRLPKAA